MDLEMGNLYDANKQLVKEHCHPLTDMELPVKQKLVTEWFEDHVNDYAMMLCHELRDYTLFCLGPLNSCYKKAGKEVLLCCKNRGEIYSIELTNDGAVEIWLKIEDEMHCYYLFNYDEGVIDCN